LNAEYRKEMEAFVSQGNDELAQLKLQNIIANLLASTN